LAFALLFIVVYPASTLRAWAADSGGAAVAAVDGAVVRLTAWPDGAGEVGWIAVRPAAALRV
jgi:hypothetical protein